MKMKVLFKANDAKTQGLESANEVVEFLKSLSFEVFSLDGSYDCPEVWTLRRFRDNKLSQSFLGNLFIRFYYFQPNPMKQNFFKSKRNQSSQGFSGITIPGIFFSNPIRNAC